MTLTRPSRLVTAALYFYAFSLPLETPVRSIPVEVHTASGVLLLLAALTQPRVAFARPHPAFWCFGAYLYVYLCLGVLTDHVGEWLKEAAGFFQVLLIFWVSTSLMRWPHVTTRVLASFIVSCVLLAVLQRAGITESVAEVNAVAQRMTALGQNPNTLAHNLAIAMLALAGLVYGSQRFGRWLQPAAWMALGLLAVVIMPTAARGALLSLVVGLCLIVLNRARPSVRLRNAVVAVALLCGVGAAAYRSDAMRNRFLTATEAVDLAQREQLFPAAWQMTLESPFVGWGPINNRYELERHVPRAELPFREAHNLVLELLTQTGLVGAIPFLLGVAFCIRGAWVARLGPHGIIPATVMASSLIALMATSGLYTKMYWFAYALAAGCELHVRDQSRSRARSTIEGRARRLRSDQAVITAS
jgi:O-antigen ligase